MECRNLTGAKAQALEPWQKRVTEEQIQLLDRMKALDAFMADEERFSRVQAAERADLIRQRGIMQEYWEVLDRRIGRFIGEETL